MGICCMAQETQTVARYQPRGLDGERGSKGREYMYTYAWFILRFDRKQQNSVKQLSFNWKKKPTVEYYIFCRVYTHPTPPQDKEGTWRLLSGIQKEMEQIYYNSQKIIDQIFKYCSKFKKKKHCWEKQNMKPKNTWVLELQEHRTYWACSSLCNPHPVFMTEVPVASVLCI